MTAFDSRRAKKVSPIALRLSGIDRAIIAEFEELGGDGHNWMDEPNQRPPALREAPIGTWEHPASVSFIIASVGHLLLWRKDLGQSDEEGVITWSEELELGTRQPHPIKDYELGIVVAHHNGFAYVCDRSYGLSQLPQYRFCLGNREVLGRMIRLNPEEEMHRLELELRKLEDRW